MRILHLIHATTFGGVEAAAERLRLSLGTDGRDGRSVDPAVDVEYRVAALAGAPAGQEVVHADVTGRSVNSPLAALRLLAEARRSRPDVVVSSLWRVVALGPLARRLSPGTRWVVWVHLSRYTNVADRLVHQWCLPRADEILCDSEASYEAIVRPALARAGTTVPFRIVRPGSLPLDADGPGRSAPADTEPVRLVFWGRMARQKRLDLVIELAARLGARRPGGVELLLVGPDDGERTALERQAARLPPRTRVRFSGPLDRADLAREARLAHVFVQLSDFEGYAMSAHEALAAGMVCVLTPVGDLAVDSVDGSDSLHHDGDLDRTTDRLLTLVSDPPAFSALGAAARHRDDAASGFVSAFVGACREVSAGGAS